MKHNTQKALSSLDFAIAECTRPLKMDDEFTLAEYIVKSKMPRSTAQQNLDNLVSSGVLSKRKISIDGSLRNLFKKTC
jgi:predicted transcriptional regulator